MTVTTTTTLRPSLPGDKELVSVSILSDAILYRLPVSIATRLTDWLTGNTVFIGKERKSLFDDDLKT